MSKSNTVAELKKMARQQGVKGYSTMKKQELIDALGAKKRSRSRSPVRGRSRSRSPQRKSGGQTVAELKKMARQQGIKGYSTMKKQELIDALASSTSTSSKSRSRSRSKSRSKNTEKGSKPDMDRYKTKELVNLCIDNRINGCYSSTKDELYSMLVKNGAIIPGGPKAFAERKYYYEFHIGSDKAFEKNYDKRVLAQRERIKKKLTTVSKLSLTVSWVQNNEVMVIYDYVNVKGTELGDFFNIALKNNGKLERKCIGEKWSKLFKLLDREGLKRKLKSSGLSSTILSQDACFVDLDYKKHTTKLDKTVVDLVGWRAVLEYHGMEVYFDFGAD